MVKVALTYIIKDDSEAGLFERSLNSYAKYFDKVFVVVTGVSGEHDKIHKLVKKFKGVSISTNPQTHPQIYEQTADGSFEFFRFNEARKVSFDLVPEGYDYVSWADVDDVLQGGEEIAPLLENAKKHDIDLVFCTYYYQFTRINGVLEPIIQHERERFIKRNGFKWSMWLHEVLIPIEGKMEDKKALQYSFDPQKKQNLLWLHETTHERSMKALQRNLRILEAQARHENYSDPRTLFYLAKTYFDVGDQAHLLKANAYLDQYIKMSGWDEEIGNAWHYKGLIAQIFNRNAEAINYYKEALKVYPANINDYLRLADAYFKTNQFEFGFFYLRLAGAMETPKSRATIGTPFESRLLYINLKYQEAYIKKDMAEMERWATIRKQFIDDNLLETVLETKEFNKIAESFYNYFVFLSKSAPHKLDLLFESLVKPLIDVEIIMRLSSSRLPKTWGSKDIVYYASFGAKHFEEWTPDNLKKGIGGSETAVIQLSKEWVKQGYNVTVYCDCGDRGGVYDGVTYKHYNTINWNDNFNILILWRSPHLVGLPNVKAKKLFYDAHDIENMSNWRPDKVQKIDKVFFKSKWHRRNLPNIPEHKAVIISNGVTK